MSKIKRNIHIYASVFCAVSGLGLLYFCYAFQSTWGMLIVLCLYTLLYMMITDVLVPLSKDRLKYLKMGSKRLRGTYLLLLCMDGFIFVALCAYSSLASTLFLFIMMIAAFFRYRLKESFNEMTSI